MIDDIEIYYEESRTGVARGKKEVRNYEKEGFYRKSGGNWTYRMVKPSVVKFLFTADGKRKVLPAKKLIAETLNLQKVGLPAAERLINEYELDYSDEKGLYVKGKKD